MPFFALLQNVIKATSSVDRTLMSSSSSHVTWTHTDTHQTEGKTTCRGTYDTTQSWIKSFQRFVKETGTGRTFVPLSNITRNLHKEAWINLMNWFIKLIKCKESEDIWILISRRKILSNKRNELQIICVQSNIPLYSIRFMFYFENTEWESFPFFCKIIFTAYLYWTYILDIC